MTIPKRETASQIKANEEKPHPKDIMACRKKGCPYHSEGDKNPEGVINCSLEKTGKENCPKDAECYPEED